MRFIKEATHKAEAPVGEQTLLTFATRAVRVTAVAMLAGAFLASVARADSLSDDPPVKPPTSTDARAVRLSSVDGPVKVIQNGQVIADPAVANMPIFEGTQISTGAEGNAEIQFEDGAVARLSPNSSISLAVLQKQATGTRTEITVNGGLCYLELQPSSGAHNVLVRFGPASFTPSSFSVVRVTLDQPPGSLAVFSGNIHVEQGDVLQVDLHGSESLTMNAADPSNYKLDETIASDSWDSWNADRDQALNAQAGERTAASSKYNSSAAGFSDLDANGNWYDVPGQGYVWSPYDAQAAGPAFDPYGYGNWVNYPNYGYLFVSGYDWGYAPYACGTWNFFDGFGWGWAPGMSCNPWWNNYGYGAYGYGGYGYNIGRSPRGYLPPRRPTTAPGRPRPVGGGMHPVVAGSGVIRVDRRPAGAGDLALSSPGLHPVTIGGRTVEPMHPLVPRQAYDRTAAGFVNRPAGPAGMHPVNTGGFGNSGQPNGVRPSEPGYAPRAPSYAPSRSTGYTPSRSAGSAPAPAPSYSGGTHSGGSMPSSGGGGGHPSGGGGSHH